MFHNFMCLVINSQRKKNNLFMVLLEISQFFIQAFNLHLQICPGHGQLIQDSAQTIDVSLHTLPKSHFILISMHKGLNITFYMASEIKYKLLMCFILALIGKLNTHSCYNIV